METITTDILTQFNSDNIITNQIYKIIKRFNIKTIVETGTFSGVTTKWFAENSEKVYTIEIDEPTYNYAIDHNFHNNIEFYLGSSEEHLPSILEKINKDELILFYLDAHSKECPILKELEIIGNYFKDNCIIIIDDFKVPYRKFQYDCYENFDLNYTLIQNSLNHVFTDYNFFYPDTVKTPKVCKPEFEGVGKIYIFPSNLNISDLYFTDKENNINYSCF